MSPAETLTFSPASMPPLSRVVLRVAVKVAAWEIRTRTRRHLRNLDSHLLKDIGLDPLTAEAEQSRSFWLP